jgi:Family of unknown function (DUF5985)
MTLVAFLQGATAMGCAAVALFFARFWRQSSDRLFLFFALSFAILAGDFALTGLIGSGPEWRVPVFAVRLAAFVVILIGIADKNRDTRP